MKPPKITDSFVFWQFDEVTKKNHFYRKTYFSDKSEMLETIDQEEYLKSKGY